MGTEIERKFLLLPDRWQPTGRIARLRQGYLASDGATVRVRRDETRGWLTIKGPPNGISRGEFEYEIPLADADHLLDTLCRKPLIEKTRHTFEHAGHTWEVDVFEGENAGLVMAEIELDSIEETFARPEWLGTEVSGDIRYTNSSLSRHPYREWAP